MILSENHDKKLFSALTLILSIILTFTLTINTDETALESAITATPIVGVLITLIVIHRQACKIWTARASSRAISFGILWSASSALAAHIEPGGRLGTLTPSAARYGFLRPVLRYLGENGIDLLLGISGYTITLWSQRLLDLDDGVSDTDSDGTGTGDNDQWEWFKLLRLSRSGQSRRTWDSSESAGVAGVTKSSDEPLLPKSTRYSTARAWSETYTTTTASNSELPGFRSYSEPARRSTQAAPLDYPPTEISNRAAYGSFDTSARSGHDLIDLESSRSRVQSTPIAEPPGKYHYETVSELISPCPSISIGTDTERGSEVERETLKTPSTSLYDVTETTTHRSPTARNRHRDLGILSVILVLIWTALLYAPLPSSLSLSAPLSQQTPLPIACVLPPGPLTLDRLVYHSQMVAGRSKLLVWPPTDLGIKDDDNLDMVVEYVRKEVTGRYGVWVLMYSVSQSWGSRMVMIGPEGQIRGPASNTVEPIDGREYEMEPTSWTLKLPPPTGVTRFNWTHTFPHLRPVHVAALDLTTASGTRPITISPHPPSVLIVTSQSRHRSLELEIARDHAVKHATPTVYCSSSLDGSTSALIDPWGRVVFQQVGGETWSLTAAVEYHYQGGQGRGVTGYEVLGDFGSTLIAALFLVVMIIVNHSLKLVQTLVKSGLAKYLHVPVDSDTIITWLADVRDRYSFSFTSSSSGSRVQDTDSKLSDAEDGTHLAPGTITRTSTTNPASE